MSDNPLRSGLIIHHFHSDELFRDLNDLIFTLGKLHPSGFTPAACMNLDLDHSFCKPQILNHLLRLCTSRSHPKIWDSHPIFF